MSAVLPPQAQAQAMSATETLPRTELSQGGVPSTSVGAGTLSGAGFPTTNASGLPHGEISINDPPDLDG